MNDMTNWPYSTPGDNTFIKLAAINVNPKVEKKGSLSYLSWAWAVDQLLRADPDGNWEFADEKRYGETVMVHCAVTAFGRTRKAHLPVMDHRNKPIANPDAFQVNTAMQRCLVKGIALHGLGLYIYAGEDLPEGAELPPSGEPPPPEESPPAPRPRGNPPSGSGAEVKKEAFESLTLANQESLRKIAADVIALLTEDRGIDAYGFLRSQRLDTEEQVGIQWLFDSKQRSALAKASEQWKLMDKAAITANAPKEK